jgi:hypothetical protein
MPGPQLKAGGGEFKVRSASSIMADPLNLPQFPGPLKKGKKKELSAWLKAHIESMETNLQAPYPVGQASQVRLSERVLLWKIMALLVEHDGILEGTPAVDEAVIALLSPPAESSFPVALTGAVQPAGDILPDSPTPKELGVLREHLSKGDRVKAVWHAVDERLWGPALLIASTLDKDIWKQVIQEFVRKEVRDKALAALFQVFAGNWDESVDELVSVSARAGFQMVSTANGGSEQQNALAGLERWRETILLILSNRSPGDAQSLLAIGKILAGYGRFEAAHICFLFARSHAFFGGADDPASTYSLVGGDPKFLGADFGGNLESILLSEVYEYALSVAPTPITPIPHLQAYKLYHAEVLAENGFLTEAQHYADAINAIIHSKTKGSPCYNVVLMQAVDDLSKRLSEAPADPAGSWKPSMDKVSNSLWGKFNSFVTGDNDASPTPSVLNDQGQFQPLAGGTPPMSTATSNIDMYSAYQSGAPAPSPATNSRYAPGNVYSPRRSNDHGARSKYEPAAPSYQPRTSMESTRSSYEGRPSLEVTQPLSPKRVSSFPALVQPQQNGAAPSPLRAVDPFSQRPHSANPYQPAGNGDMHPYGGYGQSLDQPQFQNGGAEKPQPTPIQHPVQPSSYEPSGSYEPPSYQPYEPSYQEPAADEVKDEDDEKPKPKSKSYMDDDDDDDLMARVAALKNNSKPKAREVDDAFKKAAEADGKKQFRPGENANMALAARPVTKNQKSGWFGGWFGGSKAETPGAPGAAPNKPVKANLGEANQFVFDPDLGKWINKAAGAAPAAPAPAATPPPPRATPPVSSNGGPIGLGLGAPPPPPTPASVASLPGATKTPPTPSLGPAPSMGRSVSMPQTVAALSSAGSGPPSRPPSRPTTSLSNASDIDDLLGPPAPRSRAAGGSTRGKRKGRYVDVMAK